MRVKKEVVMGWSWNKGDKESGDGWSWDGGKEGSGVGVELVCG